MNAMTPIHHQGEQQPMSMERVEVEIQGFCPVCSAVITSPAPVDETEILACPECRSMLVVDGRDGRRLSLSEAPRIEEDWGE